MDADQNSKFLTIVGTSHGYQVLDSSRSTAAGARQFQSAMIELCREQNIAGVAEEMSEYALTYRGGEESAGRYAAKALGLPHVMCDLDEKERAALGIDAPNTIFALAFIRGEDEPTQELIREKNYEPREKIWLERVLKFDRWPCLFICGSDHVESFKKKLSSEGVVVFVWDCDWEPQPG